jgi:hypothetical protein
MNTGIGDALNLGWKLAAVLQRRADPRLLESYEEERRPFALRLVATTDRAFEIVTRRGRIARWVRLQLVPRVLSWAFRFRAFRRFLFRTVSQIQIHYRASAFNEGRVGRVRGGDRLPWVAPIDNHAPLASLDWQVHVYGEPTAALVELCRARALPVHAFPWSDDAARAGLRRSAIYLVRPDGYLGWVGGRRATRAMRRYLDERSLLSMREQAAAVVPDTEIPSFGSLTARAPS